MCYNLIKFLCRTTLVLTVMFFGIKAGWAQGTVSLSDDIEDELGIDSNVPDEISLFSEEDDDEFTAELNNGLLQPAGVVEASSEVVSATTTVTTDSTDNNTADNTQSTINFSGEDTDAFDQYGATANTAPISAPIAPVVIDDNFGEDILTQIDDKLFSQMSDIEKQTALLTLELRREKIKNEIEAIRLQRQKAIELEEATKEQKAREKAEWENEQQRKLIAEQTRLQEENIKLEKLRQEKVINAYKNEMLQTNQKWIASLNTAYEKIRAIETEKNEHLEDFKTKMSSLSHSAKKIGVDAIAAKESYDREIQNLQTQISILNTRIETLAKEKADAAVANSSSVDNPFAGGPSYGANVNANIKLSDEYVIMEIRGKGEEITAKIANKIGTEAFFVRKGTTLKSGHKIDEITPTFIRADKSGEKDFLYFSAGGVLDREPEGNNTITPLGTEEGGVYGNQRSNNPKTQQQTVKVPDSFLDQMFAN